MLIAIIDTRLPMILSLSTSDSSSLSVCCCNISSTISPLTIPDVGNVDWTSSLGTPVIIHMLLSLSISADSSSLSVCCCKISSASSPSTFADVGNVVRVLSSCTPVILHMRCFYDIIRTSWLRPFSTVSSPADAVLGKVDKDLSSGTPITVYKSDVNGIIDTRFIFWIAAVVVICCCWFLFLNWLLLICSWV
ncbi:uncharacterized protein LOC133289779 [Gastrolobium bilobum]|uniref:uncharacterized protein LOC133289779 n=1 Tax=Gastrolobium bilobum TaxID=150636 RepID=UPI002AB030A9|nr:uncharacterized protein LOC133289779 [Gastrolobium bilobum]